MIVFIPLISGILYRLDGWGKGDSFLPFWPFTQPKWKIGGINYARYAIGPVIACFTLNWWYILTYSIAVSIPYGENSITTKIFGQYRWFIIGVAFGAASMNWGNTLFCGCFLMVMKFFDTDQAWFEVLTGFCGTLIFWFHK